MFMVGRCCCAAQINVGAYGGSRAWGFEMGRAAALPYREMDKKKSRSEERLSEN